MNNSYKGRFYNLIQLFVLPILEIACLRVPLVSLKLVSPQRPFEFRTLITNRLLRPYNFI